MTRYDFAEAREMILTHIWTDSSSTYFSLLINFVCELGANNEQIWFPSCIIKNKVQIINTNKSGFRILKSTTILKNNFKNYIQSDIELLS